MSYKKMIITFIFSQVGEFDATTIQKESKNMEYIKAIWANNKSSSSLKKSFKNNC